MYTTLTTLLALTTLPTALPKPLLKRQSNCNYHPNQTTPHPQSTPAYILRIENLTTNTSLGYLDAFASTYALLSSSKQSASQAFNAPSWNTNEALIFWNGNQTEERGLNIDQSALWSGETIAPAKTPGCGTRTEALEGKYEERGACGVAGQKVTASTGCPTWGTTNDAGETCVKQKFFACNTTGLDGVSDDTTVVYYGIAATAQYGPNCQEVDLVSECP